MLRIHSKVEEEAPQKAHRELIERQSETKSAQVPPNATVFQNCKFQSAAAGGGSANVNLTAGANLGTQTQEATPIKALRPVSTSHHTTLNFGMMFSDGLYASCHKQVPRSNVPLR